MNKDTKYFKKEDDRVELFSWLLTLVTAEFSYVTYEASNRRRS